MSILTFPPLDEGIPPIALGGVGMEDFLLALFAGLGTMAVVIQLLPGLMLFSSMVRSIFSTPRQIAPPGNGAGNGPA
ncbi:hypothetical protein [Geobacter pickeringii]|uniref:hypothetical protein n=1 Tax=Geobacter pickeringii TaxID=345632 RepID=UPI000690CC1E|nr:hypothetical protein [Geobacter pickeringii]